MARGLTLATQELWRRLSVTDPIISLVEITAPNIPGSPFIGVENRAVHTYGNFTYSQWAMQVDIPEQGPNTIPELSIVLGNVNTNLGPYITAEEDNILENAYSLNFK